MSHDLNGRRIAVGGGSGDVGIEIVKALLACGAEVVVPVRNRERGESLPKTAALTIVEGFPDSESALPRLREALRRAGPIDGAVAALGSWFHGPPLVDLDSQAWERVIAGSLSTHYFFARLVYPLLARGNPYVMINGGAALEPASGSGVVSVAASAQLMLGKVLAAENRQIPSHTLLLHSPVATRARTAPRASWVTASEVGAVCAWLLGDEGRLTAGSTVTLGLQPWQEV